MSHAQAAAAQDRLPWLANEATPRSKHNLREISGWLVAAALLVGGSAYLIVEKSAEPVPEVAPARTTTVMLPQGQPAAPQNGQAGNLAAKKVRPLSKNAGGARSQGVASPKSSRTKGATNGDGGVPNDSAAAKDAKAKAQAPRAMKASVAEPVAYSRTRNPALNPQPATGAPQIDGRVVHLGAFADVEQAKFVWRGMVHAYPAVAQFEPSVIENRDWNGHPFYQFQVGTASQADSEMLCQSMQRYNFRCAVVGLPSKVQR